MSSRAYLTASIAALTFLSGVDSSASADEVYFWQRMQLYCSASENKAVLLAQGSWNTGELELPQGMLHLVSDLEHKDNATCILPDGRTVRVTQSRLPFGNGHCGADPGAMFSLYLNGVP